MPATTPIGDPGANPEVDLRVPKTDRSALPSHKQRLIESSTTQLEVEDPKRLRPARKLSSFRTIAYLGLDLLLAIPPICFLVYAFLVYKHRGKKIDEDPVPALQNAAIFPIAFAAIVGNLLKALAAWKLERGVSILSLEYLLGSRTVFSTITTSFSLRTANAATLCLIALWSLSPLGGQAAFRIVDSAPTAIKISQPFHYLEVMSGLSHTGPFSPSGPELLPSILGVFTTALSAPAHVKAASQDSNGNIKIPMLEALDDSHTALEDSDWLAIPKDTNWTYSAIAGLPVSGPKSGTNSTFTLKTSYMYANCSISHAEGMLHSDWYGYMYENSHIVYNNRQTLVIQTGNVHQFSSMPPTPLNLIFTSYTYHAVTNATCNLTTTYIDAQVFCRSLSCKIPRVRPSATPLARADLTVLDGLGPSGAQDFSSQTQTWYLSSLINATNTPWAYTWSNDPYSTPLEYYFTHPDSPYSMEYVSTGPASLPWLGADIYPIGDVLFSQRFSQLLNTFWMANVAPMALMGNFSLDDAAASNMQGGNISNYVAVDGVVTPDYLELTYSKAWMAILILASAVMLFASVIAAVLGALRRGPDLLDRTAMFVRDNPYVRVEGSGSMEDGFDQARRLKDVRLCIGDAKDGDDAGYLAVGTMDAVRTMSRVHTSRLFE